MATFSILTTMLMIAIIFSWTFKKTAHRLRARRKRSDHVDHDDELAASESISAPTGASEDPGDVERDEIDARITFLESKLKEKEFKLKEKEFKLKEKEIENLQLKKEALKFKDKNRELKKNIKKYRARSKETRQAASKTRKETSTTGGTRTGKPPGSAGGGFTLPPNLEPHEEKAWVLDICPHCGKKLKHVKVLSSWTHVILDLVRPKTWGGMGLMLKITRHVINRYRCPRCKRLVSKDFGSLKRAHYGVGMIAFVMAERIENRAPWNRVENTLYRIIRNDAFIPTIAAFIQWMQRYEPEVRQMYEAIRASIKESVFAHVDESGIPKDGANWWMWVVVTGHVVLFLQDASRGHQVIKDIFDDYKGILLSDFWTAYNCLDVEQQKCLAHLVKELREMAHEATKKGDKVRGKLDADAKVKEGALNEARALGRGRPKKAPGPLEDEEVAALEVKTREHDKAFDQVTRLGEFFKLAWGDGEMGYKAPVKGRITIAEATSKMQALIDAIREEGTANADIERIITRMEKHAPALFTYLEHLGIPPDNNPAERALRHFVVQRKVSANFISDDALSTYAMHLSLYLTCLKQGIDYDTVLGILLEGRTGELMVLLGLPAPDPPPDLDISGR